MKTNFFTSQNLVKTSYSSDDVTILCKDITGQIQSTPTKEREKLIQQGTHYSEMLPVEKVPSKEFTDLYEHLLGVNAQKTAEAIAVLAHKLYDKFGGSFICISLARAGTPVGVLLRRYFSWKWGIDVPHYSVSIIRGKDLDFNALRYIRDKHPDVPVSEFQFVDGWTGKGAITNQLKASVTKLQSAEAGWEDLSPDIAVLADPACICDIAGTYEDFLVPSSCFNSTVSGLVSRTVLREDLINTDAGDFHGAVYYKEFEDADMSNAFVDEIEKHFMDVTQDQVDTVTCVGTQPGIEVVKALAEHFGIADINKIKPGIGESTRVLLRRVPWKVVVNPFYKQDPELEYIFSLCKQKDVPVEFMPIGNYKVCGIIKDVSADA